MSLQKGEREGQLCQLSSYARSHDESNRSILSTIRLWISKLYTWWRSWWDDDDEGTLLKVEDGRITVTGTEDDRHTMFRIYEENVDIEDVGSVLTYRIQTVENRQLYIGIEDDHVVVKEQTGLGDRSVYFQVHQARCAGCIALQSVAHGRRYLCVDTSKGTTETCHEGTVETSWFKLILIPGPSCSKLD